LIMFQFRVGLFAHHCIQVLSFFMFVRISLIVAHWPLVVMDMELVDEKRHAISMAEKDFSHETHISSLQFVSILSSLH
jgi:hypothetical protein